MPIACVAALLLAVAVSAAPAARLDSELANARALDAELAMRELQLSPDGRFRKCARVVGDVIGKYHPHGDVAVYDALVRMAQDFVMSARLVDGHGNFGSIDADPPAAMRYTECRLTRFAQDALMADLGAAVVDFADNFDGSEVEPRVLPARFPLLLLNGATGIAVGMATNIPPHNLRELADALLAMIASFIGVGDVEAWPVGTPTCRRPDPASQLVSWHSAVPFECSVQLGSTW